uniref:Zinc finger, CCHC-type n=1 Tax=Tanacetum cinerariifolium TaxID=118510 RepID=A0A6L2NEM6_TANCI|nr:hypothetical protein [Tanacetum cinerariifolium]
MKSNQKFQSLTSKIHISRFDDSQTTAIEEGNEISGTVKASKERLDVVKYLMACKPKPGASICAFVLEMKGYFLALVLTVGYNAKKIKTSHPNWKVKAAQGKSNHGFKRKVESEIAPTSDPKEAMCFYCNKVPKGPQIWKG